MKLYFTEKILLSLSTSIRSFSKSQWSTLEGEATEGNMAGGREIEIEGHRERRQGWREIGEEQK